MKSTPCFNSAYKPVKCRAYSVVPTSMIHDNGDVVCKDDFSLYFCVLSFHIPINYIPVLKNFKDFLNCVQDVFPLTKSSNGVGGRGWSMKR